MWLLLIIVVPLAFLLYSRIAKSMNYWKDRNVPYIKPVPVLGNSTLMVLRKRSFAEHVRALYNAYPDKRCYGSFQFMTPQLVIRYPELIKLITVKDFDHFTDRTTVVREDAEPIFTKNLAGLKGQTWRDMRSALSPSFTSSKMRFLFALITDCAEQFTQYFEKEGFDGAIEVEMKDAFSRFTNDAIASAAFGVTVDSLKDKENEFFLAGKDLSNFRGLRLLRFFGYALFPSLMRLLKVPFFSPAVSTFFRRVVKETIQVREEKGVVRPDMIHMLLEARNGRLRAEEESHADDGFAVVQEVPSGDKVVEKHHKAILSDDDITAQALIFFLGGFETTSTALSFLAYELALHPDIQSKLQAEVDEVWDGFDGRINYEAVMKMKYLDMVVSETLRKWTPGIALDRICVKDYVIPPKLPGELPITIEKGTTITIPVIGIHLDPRHFPHPDEFDPERFSDQNKGDIASCTYMPFGSGPRNCIASRFALMEIKILACHLLAKFDITPSPKTVIPIVLSKASFNMIPYGGLWLSFKRRNKSNKSSLI